MVTKYIHRPRGKEELLPRMGGFSCIWPSPSHIYHYVAIVEYCNWCVLCTLSSPTCQPIAISRPSWRNRGALYTEYGVQIRCVRRDQSSSVGNLPPSPFLSSLLLPSSFFYSPPLYSFPWAIRHSTQPSPLSLPPSFTLFSPLFPSLLHSLDTLTPSFTLLSNTWALYKPYYYYAETWFTFVL